jgi:hypothetical protein
MHRAPKLLAAPAASRDPTGTRPAAACGRPEIPLRSTRRAGPGHPHLVCEKRSGDDNDGTVTVLSASTRNAHCNSGCLSSAPTAQVGYGRVATAVDHATDTIYVMYSNSDTMYPLRPGM